jgi:hypothetical protein
MGRTSIAVFVALVTAAGPALAQQGGVSHPVVAPNQRLALDSFAAALAASAPTVVTTPTHGRGIAALRFPGAQPAPVAPYVAPYVPPGPVTPYVPPPPAAQVAQVAAPFEPAPLVSEPFPSAEERRTDSRFSLDAAIGAGVISYSEKVTALGLGGDSDFDEPVGIARLVGRGRIVGNLFAALGWQGSFTLDGTETWPGVGTIFGLPVTQSNDLNISQHLVDGILGYTWTPWRGFSLEPTVGWHYLRQEFDRSKFTFAVAGITFPVPIGPVSEDFSGHGPLIGLDGSLGGLPLGLSVEAGAQFVYLIDLDADNSLLGTIGGSDGRSWRWHVDLTLPVGRFDLGLGYYGQYQVIDTQASAIAILPENETQVHVLQAVARIPF